MEINRMIDHTILKADAKLADVMKIIEEAKNIVSTGLPKPYLGGVGSKRITRRACGSVYRYRFPAWGKYN